MAAAPQKRRPRVPSPPSSDDESNRTPALKRQKRKHNTANFVDVYGQEARPEVDITSTSPIRISDVQALLLWVLADGVMPSWAFVKHKPLLQRVIMVAIPGIDAECFSTNASLLSNMHQLGSPITVFSKSHHCNSADAVQALFSVPLDKKRRREEAAAAAAEDSASAAPSLNCNGILQGDIQVHPQFPIEGYVMNLKARLAHGLRVAPKDAPAGTVPLPPGFIVTSDSSVSPATEPNGKPSHTDSKCSTGEKQASPGSANSGNHPECSSSEQNCSSAGRQQPVGEDANGTHDMVALDCEMCYCGTDNLEVTRLSLLGSRGQVLLDELVVPELPITDYNTRYSGITAEMMSGATLSLSAARAAMLQHLKPHTILVGHALENDLEKLRIVHDRIIDTGNLYPHPRGPPYKQGLRFLTKRYLNRAIQEGQHDSVEDARAALQLAVLKFRHGPGWGCGNVWGGRAERLMNVLSEANCRATLVDRPQSLKQHTTGTADAIKVETDVKAASAAQRAAQKPGGGFVWTQFTSLAAFYDRRAKERTPKGGPITAAAASLDATTAAYSSTSPSPPAIRQQHPAATMLPEGHPTSGSITSGASVTNSRSKAVVGTGLSPRHSDRSQSDQSRPPRSGISSVPSNGSRQTQKEVGAQQLQQSPTSLSDSVMALDGGGATGAEARILAEIDRLVGDLHAAAPVNSLLLVYTVQGDTAECRRLQQQKWRRQQDPPLDGQPPWDANGEEAVFRAVSSRVTRALCFAVVKQPPVLPS